MKTVYYCDCHNNSFFSKDKCTAHEEEFSEKKKVMDGILAELKGTIDILKKYRIREVSWSYDVLTITFQENYYPSFCEKFELNGDRYKCLQFDNDYLGRCFIKG